MSRCISKFSGFSQSSERFSKSHKSQLFSPLAQYKALIPFSVILFVLYLVIPSQAQADLAGYVFSSESPRYLYASPGEACTSGTQSAYGADYYAELGEFLEISEDYICRLYRTDGSLAGVNKSLARYADYYLTEPEQPVTPEHELDLNSCSVEPGPTVSNPVNTSSGNKIHKEKITFFSGLFASNFTLTYNSLSQRTSILGKKWQHSNNRKITRVSITHIPNPSPEYSISELYPTPVQACQSGWNNLKGSLSFGWVSGSYATLTATDQCEIKKSDGKTWKTLNVQSSVGAMPGYKATEVLKLFRSGGAVIEFFDLGNGVWGNNIAKPELVVEELRGLGGILTGYRYITKSGEVESYNENGRLGSSISRSGYATTFGYNAEGQLTTISDSLGRSANFDYETAGNLDTITSVRGVYTFSYDANNNLSGISYPGGDSKTYIYDDLNWPNALTGIIDENGNRYATYAYNLEGKAILSEHAGGDMHATLVYNADGTTTVTDGRGQIRTYQFERISDVSHVTQIAGPPCSSCSIANKAATYDINGNPDLVTDFNDNVTDYDYDLTINNVIKQVEAVGTPEQRRTDYIYDPRFNNKITSRIEVSVVTGSTKTTTYVYDDFANRTSMSVAGFRPDGTAVSRTTSYQYTGPLNQLSQIDGPRTDVTDVTTLDYYSNDVTQGFNRGRLQRITGPAGIVLRDNILYTATDKTLSEDRPNGISLAYTYYAGNDRLETLTETSSGAIPSSRVTRWTYLATGEVETITQADGTVLATTTRLVYDDARRLIGMVDQLGNHIDYVLDTEGNRTDEKVFDSANVLYKSVQQTFDIYNRLDTRTLVDEIIDYNFQPDGSLDNSINAKNVSTDFQYDALQRLTTTTGDMGGTDADTQDTLTQYVYDAGDRLTSVTSPNNNSTYSYDDLGNLLSETSPDRGLRSYTYDEAGNVSSITDARSITVNYSYDTLNRVTTIDYPDTAEDIAMTYDTATGCANGLGKLCRVTDNSGTTAYTYNAFGNLAQQTATQLGVIYSTGYSYDALNRVTRMTAPSGRDVTYTYDALGRTASIDAVVNGSSQTVVHNTQYRPDGLLTDIEHGLPRKPCLPVRLIPPPA